MTETFAFENKLYIGLLVVLFVLCFFVGLMALYSMISKKYRILGLSGLKKCITLNK